MTSSVTARLRRSGAFVSALLLALLSMWLVALPASATPGGNSCPQSDGWVKVDDINGGSGSAAGAWGSVSWSDATVEWDLATGVELELCIKSGDKSGADGPYVHPSKLTGSGSLTTGPQIGGEKAQELSHIAYRLTIPQLETKHKVIKDWGEWSAWDYDCAKLTKLRTKEWSKVKVFYERVTGGEWTEVGRETIASGTITDKKPMSFKERLEHCKPAEPPAKVIEKVKEGDWVDGTWECDDTTVEQTREVTTKTITIPYKFDKVRFRWVLDHKNATVESSTETENQSRDLEGDEIFPCPPVEPEVVDIQLVKLWFDAEDNLLEVAPATDVVTLDAGEAGSIHEGESIPLEAGAEYEVSEEPVEDFGEIPCPDDVLESLGVEVLWTGTGDEFNADGSGAHVVCNGAVAVDAGEEEVTPDETRTVSDETEVLDETVVASTELPRTGGSVVLLALLGSLSLATGSGILRRRKA